MMQENGLATGGRAAGGERWHDPVSRLADRVLLGSLSRALSRHGIGRLRLALPSGEVAVLGRNGDACEAHLKINSYRALWRMSRGGSLGFAECYMDDSVSTDNLRAVFEFYVANERVLTASHPSLLSTPRRDRKFHVGRRNTLQGSRRNIAAHYDLGNEFYKLWLDQSMSYSSGIFEGDHSLEEAQRRKIARVLDVLELEPGMSLLEFGCGWGGMAIAAAQRGARVEAITISQEQHAESRRRVLEAGVSESVAVRLEDYRSTAGTFDRLVSIEMIEAVGEENWRDYFEIVEERLKPGGQAIIQAITIDESTFDRYRRNPDFIQRYIFPGGMLPTVSQMRRTSESAGLAFEVVQQFGHSYARTLAEWRSRFELAWPRIQSLGFDDRFRRMWLYYLTYCEAGFEHGSINVGLYRLRKPLS
jgi:cyclopropane-fatty-acyl-phospholipid synthase